MTSLQQRRTLRYGGSGLAVAMALLAGCGVLSPEEQLLTDFFEASRLNDTTVVSRISRVTFNPRIEGIVDSFNVERVEDSGARGERVTVKAHVRDFSGHVRERRLLFTLQREDGGWFVAAVAPS